MNDLIYKAINLSAIGKSLDIGCGNGKYSIFMSGKGFNVEALDKNKEILNNCKKHFKENNLKIKTILSDIQDFDFLENKYSLIIAKNSLHLLKSKEIELIIQKIYNSLRSEGIFFIEIFSTKDPVFRRSKKNLKIIEKNTFFVPKMNCNRHFFTKRELKKLLKPFQILYLQQRKVEDKSNHSHNIIETIAKK